MTATHTDEIELWPGGTAPGMEGATQVERMGESPFVGVVRYNVTRPRLDVVRPPEGTANGAAVIIAPGGGFHFLTMDNEGFDLATQLTPLGITCFVLTYRLIETPADSETAKAAVFEAFTTGHDRIETFAGWAALDAVEAVRAVRSRAADYAVDADRIALVGFSAGARVTAAAALQDDAAARPDLAGVIYLPTMPAHVVPDGAPPLFVAAAVDDPLGIDGNEQLYRSWRAAGRPVELHLFEAGSHGFGVRAAGAPSDAWVDLLLLWLRHHGWSAARR